MKMTISNKLIISFTLMALLIIAAGGAGIYGAHQLKTITQFIVGEAWDTADGAMEGTIGLQKQVIIIEEILAANDHIAAMKEYEAEFHEAQDMTSESLQRLTNAGIMDSAMISELNNNLQRFYSAQENLLHAILKPGASHASVSGLVTNYKQQRKSLISFLEHFEEIADGKVEGEINSVNSLTTFVDSLILGTLALGLIAAFAISFISKSQISKPIAMAADRLKEIANGDGDLTVSLPVKGNDEIADLSNSFNTFIGEVRSTVIDVNNAAQRISNASDRMCAISATTSQGLNKQHSETEQVASSTNEMASTVEEVAKNAAAAAEAATSANTEAMKGKDIVVSSTHNIDSLASQVKETADIIGHLEDDSNAIGSILDVIKDIAEQTNLLALNAAIEAARAGEMGRGFAVVADEVRNLAQRTQVSTQEIQEMIEKLQSRAQNAARAMETGQNQAQNTVEQAHQAADALSRIAEAVATINDMNMQIAASAEEQSAVTEEINRNISNITMQAEETSQASSQTAETGQELASLANELNSRIHHFKV